MCHPVLQSQQVAWRGDGDDPPSPAGRGFCLPRFSRSGKGWSPELPALRVHGWREDGGTEPCAAAGSKGSPASHTSPPTAPTDGIWKNASLHLRTREARVSFLRFCRIPGSDQPSLVCPRLVRQVANRPAKLKDEIKITY